MRSRSNLLLAAVCAAATACGNPVLGINLRLATKGCGSDVTRDPSAGVTQLRFTISGDNLSPVSVTAPFSQGSAQVPNVAVGRNRRLVVEGLTAGGLVHSRADSGLFDASGTADVPLSLALRVVDGFASTSDGSGGCTTMVSPRAGHAMALLPDGRVLITGGFTYNGSIQVRSDAEIFDPATGSFTPAPTSPSFLRFGHAALNVQSGTRGPGILLLGGEGPDSTGHGGPVSRMELFAGGGWAPVQGTANSVREHAAAAVDARTGYALLLGGQSAPDEVQHAVFDGLSFYDPQTGAVRDSALRLRAGAITDAVAVARVNQPHGAAVLGGVMLVGGRDQTLTPSAQISGVLFTDTINDFVDDRSLATIGTLSSPRYRHVAVRLNDDTVLTAGGVTQKSATAADDYASVTDAVTVIDPVQGYVADAPARLTQARADSCAAVLENGEVLVTGGAWKDANGLHAANLTDVIEPQGKATAVRALEGPGLAQGRYRAACLRLRDGSVLVTGGLQTPPGGGLPAALASAEIFTPARTQ